MGMAIDFMTDPRITQAAVSSIGRNAALTGLPPEPKHNRSCALSIFALMVAICTCSRGSTAI